MKHVSKAHLMRSAAGISLERKDSSGEPTMAQIKVMIEDLMKNFEETKSAQDKKLGDIEKKGVTDALVDEKIKRLDEDFAKKHKEVQTALQEIEKKANRPALGDKDRKDAELELKNFNRDARAHAIRNGKPQPAELTPEQFAEYKSAFERYLMVGKEELTPEERKAATIGQDPNGGYLVLPELDAAITRVVTNMGAMRQLAAVRTIGGSTLKMIVQTTGAGFGGWGNERKTPSETDTPKLSVISIEAGTCWAEPQATTEMIEDATIDVASWLISEVDLIFDANESSGFIRGDGVEKPKGLLTYDTVLNANYEWGKVGYVKTGGAVNFAAANPSDAIIDLMHAPKRAYRSNASFLMTDMTLAAIRKFKDGQGNYLWVPGLQGGVVGVLLGKPVVTDDYMDELGANKFPIVYGDFQRGYQIVDRRGTTVLRDPFTAKPNVKFYVTRRVGGGMKNFEALKFLKCEA